MLTEHLTANTLRMGGNLFLGLGRRPRQDQRQGSLGLFLGGLYGLCPPCSLHQGCRRGSKSPGARSVGHGGDVCVHLALGFRGVFRQIHAEDGPHPCASNAPAHQFGADRTLLTYSPTNRQLQAHRVRVVGDADGAALLVAVPTLVFQLLEPSILYFLRHLIFLSHPLKVIYCVEARRNFFREPWESLTLSYLE